ncbi:MAG: hypothetical protein V4773_25825 [Verrucomicrobiota bacterium]
MIAASTFENLPSWLPWLAIFCVGLALVVGVGFNMVLKGFKEFSSGITEMVQREIAAKEKSSNVSVQQPLVVKPHDSLVSLSQHTELRKEFEDLRDQRRKDVGGLHKKIEEGLEKVRDDLAGEFKEVRETQVKAREEIAVLKNETATQTRQLNAVESKLDDLPGKIIAVIDRKASK